MHGSIRVSPDNEDRRAGEKLFWLLVVAAALHMLYYYPLLPDRVASHFDGSGRPDGWSGKAAFFAIYAGVVLLLVVIRTATGFSLARMPVSLINLPNKDYWLSQERRAESMAALTTYLSGFWSATLIFLICTMDLAFRVNLGRRQVLGDWFFVLLGGYVLFTVAWAVSLIRRFAKKDRQGYA